MRLLLLSILLLCISGCTGVQQLSKHQLEEKNVFVSFSIPESPFADFNMTIFDKVGKIIPAFERNQPLPNNTPKLVINTPEYDESLDPENRTEAHVIIDSVLAAQSMSDQIIAFTKTQSARQLRFTSVESENEADYTLHIEIDDYGIGADSWNTTAYFEISATVTLVEQESGKRIWQEEVNGLATVTKALLQAGTPHEKTGTPALLAKKSYNEMEDILTGLAMYGASQLTLPLRDAYRQTITKEKTRLVGETE